MKRIDRPCISRGTFEGCALAESHEPDGRDKFAAADWWACQGRLFGDGDRCAGVGDVYGGRSRNRESAAGPGCGRPEGKATRAAKGPGAGVLDLPRREVQRWVLIAAS